MEVSCSFNVLVGSPCSYDRRDKSKVIAEVPLLSCNKDIESHKSTWSFAGVQSESQLILVRAGIFYINPKDVNALTICPFHRSELGIGWRRSSSSCKVPTQIAHHGKGKGVKGDRGVGREISKVIFQKTGVLVPVGSGMTEINSYHITKENTLLYKH